MIAQPHRGCHHHQTGATMKLASRSVRAIYLSEITMDFEATLASMREAQRAANEAWAVEEESPEWKQATALVEQLNDQAQTECTELLETFKASAINAESACGENGDFFIYLVTADSKKYLVAS